MKRSTGSAANGGVEAGIAARTFLEFGGANRELLLVERTEE